MNALDPVADSEAGLAAFRARVRSFLATHAPAFSGSAREGLSPEADLELGRRWQTLKSEHGFAAITLPRAYGGGGGTTLERIVFAEEEERYRLPLDYFRISLSNPVPMVVAHCTPEQRERLVPPAIRGDEIWCQLFSEPAAGSDLAALRLSARREGDRWVLNGQKLWTSWAHVADWGVVVARSDPSVEKHRGLTYFFLSMRTPGVTVRPVKLLSGSLQLNEVFFDDVEIGDDQRMGGVGEGFRLVLETLMIERYGVADPWGFGPDLAGLTRILRGVTLNGREVLRDPVLAEAFAEALVEEQAVREIYRRGLEAIQAGKAPGPEGSVSKLLIASKRQRLARFVMDLLGPEALKLPPGALTQDNATASWLLAPQSRIAGGTDNIQRNTIAERILGLPQDHRPDKGVPFNQLSD